jgi:hypothetical protein
MDVTAVERPPPPFQECRELRLLAEVLAGEAERIGVALADYVMDLIPEFGKDDPELRAIARASAIANIVLFLEALQHGADFSTIQPPPAALAYPRLVAGRGVALEAITRSYFLAQDYFFSRSLAPTIGRLVEDPSRLVDVMAAASSAMHAYLNRVLSIVTEEYVSARDRFVRGDLAARGGLTEEILWSEQVDVDRASARLGYALSATHISWILWLSDIAESEHAGPTAETLSTAVGAALGSRSILVVPRGQLVAWGWAAVNVKRDPLDSTALLRTLTPQSKSAHLAFGEAAAGVEGFRVSHRQALRVQSAVLAARRSAPSVTRFNDVALVTLMLENADAARAFVKGELGTLADSSDANRRLRLTLRVFLASHASPAQTSRTLGMHRNSVRYRLERCEELLGSPVADRPLERHAALVLADWLDI